MPTNQNQKTKINLHNIKSDKTNEDPNPKMTKEHHQFLFQNHDSYNVKRSSWKQNLSPQFTPNLYLHQRPKELIKYETFEQNLRNTVRLGFCSRENTKLDQKSKGSTFQVVQLFPAIPRNEFLMSNACKLQKNREEANLLCFLVFVFLIFFYFVLRL